MSNKETWEPSAWLASYQDREGNEASYVTTHYELAVENDARGEPVALYSSKLVNQDAERLLFVSEYFDGYTTIEKDKYEYAIDCMQEAGRDEPNAEDELNGLRRLIDAAMEAKKQGENNANG